MVAPPARYSAIMFPVPPISAGKSANLGKPSCCRSGLFLMLAVVASVSLLGTRGSAVEVDDMALLVTVLGPLLILLQILLLVIVVAAVVQPALDASTEKARDERVDQIRALAILTIILESFMAEVLCHKLVFVYRT